MSLPCSPYVARPLRTLEQAKADIARDRARMSELLEACKQNNTASQTEHPCSATDGRGQSSPAPAVSFSNGDRT